MNTVRATEHSQVLKTEEATEIIEEQALSDSYNNSDTGRAQQTQSKSTTVRWSSVDLKLKTNLSTLYTFNYWFICILRNAKANWKTGLLICRHQFPTATSQTLKEYWKWFKKIKSLELLVSKACTVCAEHHTSEYSFLQVKFLHAFEPKQWNLLGWM